MTHCIFFNSKSDALYFFQFKIWRVVFFYFKVRHVLFFFIQNLLFKSSFEILAELLSKCYQHQRTTCWKVTTAWGKKIFSSVWHLFVSRLVLSSWLLPSLWQLGSGWVWWLNHLHHQLIYTNILNSKNG